MPHARRTTSGVLGGLLGIVGLSAVAGVLVTATVTPMIAVSSYATTSAISIFDNMPGYLTIDKLMLPTEIYAKDSAGNDYLLAEFYDQNRIPVTWDEVNPVVYDAILSSEDKNFYSHGGVDLLPTLQALAENVLNISGRGASSITQQYVKNVLQQNCERQAKSQEEVDNCFLQTTVATGNAGLERKVQEMRYAVQVEKQYTKNEILLGYLNIASFGGSVYGIGAAAEYYFGVPASELTIAQAAALAGMVQEPNKFRIDKPDSETNGAANAYAQTKDRQNYVLDRMYKDGKITKAEYDAAVEAPIEPHVTPRNQGCQQAAGAEFFCEYVRNVIVNDPSFGETVDDRVATLRRGGLKIYTTLDADLQAAARDAISVVPASVSYMNLGATGVQVEVGTGRVLSMVQNKLYSPVEVEDPSYTSVNFNARQEYGGGGGLNAGSTYKIFSLIDWMEQGHSVNEVLNGTVGTKTIKTCGENTTKQIASNSGRAGEIGNFEQSRGYTGTVQKFTVDSLNSGFLAMAEKITVCSVNQTAMRLGVMRGDGSPLDDLNVPYDLLGSANVAPIDMAQVYAAVAAQGKLCETKVIDRVTDADSVDQPDMVPETKCEQAMSAGVANTAAYVLEGVMDGTGQGARIYDGVPVFGKTGIHEYEDTWMDGSSTKVTTVVWVGNVTGDAKLNRYQESGWQLSRIRNAIWPAMQGAANAKYGGDAFPGPDSELTKQVYVTLPNVVGQTVDQATATLERAGFDVVVGDPVDASQAEGIVAEQEPGAGRVIAGTVVTIRPSNGQGTTVPPVGRNLDAAEAVLRGAGFTNIKKQCTEDEDAQPDQQQVTGTNPAAGSSTSKSAEITIEYTSRTC